MRLMFQDSTAGPAVATVNVSLDGCRGVGVTVRGATQPALDGTGLAAGQLVTMLHIRLPRSTP